LLKKQKGRCTKCGLYFQHDDPLEIDHIDGNRKNSRLINLQVLHGHCHDVKTREQREYLPVGLRDQHQNTEERSAGKLARSVLEQR
jgi:RNA-directed DNA polymerase